MMIPTPAAAERVPTPSTAPPLLSLIDAGVRFGSSRALSNISMALHGGERLALVGANGSGKTTLLRLLFGLLPHQGERVEHAPGGRRPVSAMVFQHPFLMHLTVRRNLHLALWLAGVPRAERPQRTGQALHRVGMSAQIDHQAHDLSGGQQQRLALARAWAVRPDLLFLDEPTASLDPSAKREVEALIDEFGRDGMTLVMSSHNLGQVKRLATRVIYLEAGRLVTDLPTDRFFNDALPTQAAQFLKGELPWH